MPNKYATTWDPADKRKVHILEAYDPMKFRMRDRPHTDEERAAYNAKKLSQTPQQNLKDLMRESFLMSWQACELCEWMDKFTPGYLIGRGKDKDVRVTFATLDHAMLYKLTWV